MPSNTESGTINNLAKNDNAIEREKYVIFSPTYSYELKISSYFDPVYFNPNIKDISPYETTSYMFLTNPLSIEKKVSATPRILTMKEAVVEANEVGDRILANIERYAREAAEVSHPLYME